MRYKGPLKSEDEKKALILTSILQLAHSNTSTYFILSWLLWICRENYYLLLVSFSLYQVQIKVKSIFVVFHKVGT